MNGSPESPSGHLQTALWLLIVQIAVDEQGFDTVHGLTHWRFKHKSVGWQSSLDLQPTDDGAPIIKHTLVNDIYNYIILVCNNKKVYTTWSQSI